MIYERWAQLLGAALVVALVRGLALLLAAYAVTALFKRLSGEARHLIWLGVIAGVLLIPLAWLALPAVHTAVRIPLAPAAPHRLLAAAVLSAGEYGRLYSPPRPAVAAYWALLGVWLAGILVLAARPVLGWAGLRRLAGSARSDTRGLRLARFLARHFSIHQKIAVLLCPRCTIPFTFGVRRPAILLPEGAAGWPARRLRAALTHELAHIRRLDVLTQSAAYAVCALFWFLPPVWLAYAALLREAETCCDQQVVNRGVRGRAYAREIVDLVRHSGGRILLPTVSSALGSRGPLRQRIRKLLRLAPASRPFGLRGVLQVAAVCLCCLAPVLLLAAHTKPMAVGPNDPLFGTWISEQNDRSPRYSISKAVITPGGRELQYRHIGDVEPGKEYRFTVEETWIDREGDHWYKERWASWVYPSGAGRQEQFALGRVSGGGTVLERVSAQYGCPPELGELGPKYEILHKRE
jgi:beta-lactamase regulating signal transducer with metallopeptidase domain